MIWKLKTDKEYFQALKNKKKRHKLKSAFTKENKNIKNVFTLYSDSLYFHFKKIIKFT